VRYRDLPAVENLTCLQDGVCGGRCAGKMAEGGDH
jgi:hypothetical protein